MMAIVANAVNATGRKEGEMITARSTPSGGQTPLARPHSRLTGENDLFTLAPQERVHRAGRKPLKALIWQHRDRGAHIFAWFGLPNY